ncbi:hypothetical protein BP6252_12028 [Coleophoma cylindrospora]|uniref:Uncharacterized protein n=1 Tax=Coleophoma cylindrospora TaxID=1849047 RepID=A0A3D8QFR8_9HELO|nr:hypothetical protein BP6252_12028 [Coleophoma cylindrospora]
MGGLRRKTWHRKSRVEVEVAGQEWSLSLVLQRVEYAEKYGDRVWGGEREPKERMICDMSSPAAASTSSVPVGSGREDRSTAVGSAVDGSWAQMIGFRSTGELQDDEEVLTTSAAPPLLPEQEPGHPAINLWCLSLSTDGTRPHAAPSRIGRVIGCKG